MGCCLSTNHPSDNPQITTNTSIPILEQETVKEVLSETPTLRIPKVQNSEIESPFIKIAPLLDLDFSRTVHDKIRQNGAVYKKPFAAFSNGELSEEVSEICSSLSHESRSASTDKRFNGGDEWRDLRQRQKNRPLSGEVKREKTMGMSPGRRSEASPNRVTAKKRDSGESSGRRSRSPVTRVAKSGTGQTQPARRAGRSPGRTGSGLGERIRKQEEEEAKEWGPTSNESLENPLVSLECFIFL